VPKPPPGYWAKVAHGKSATKKALQSAPTGTPTTAMIHEQSKDVLKKAKLAQKLPDLKLFVDTEISEKLAIATQKALLRSDRDDGRLLSAKYQGNVLSASVSKAQLNRAVAILNALIKEFKQRDVSTVAQHPPERYLTAFVSKSETVMVEDFPADAAWIQGDVSSVEGVQAILEQTSAIVGGVDILVNNAASGRIYPGGSVTIPDSGWQDCFNTNFFSAVRLTAALLPGMLERKSGAIVNISSGAALTPPSSAMIHYSSRRRQ
jgi:NAD(P)-dependent dehydrogenase (short-subunit alcohol dehydrogenase family)